MSDAPRHDATTGDEERHTVKDQPGRDTVKDDGGPDGVKDQPGRDPVKDDPVKDDGGPDGAKNGPGGETVNELERTARQIAQRGRDELVSRLRPAFDQAAAAHGDLLDLGPEQLESMVQQAADRADGLQWRRALAAVASEELEIGLGEALGHPAVTRAQAIVGAPSYEDSLRQLTAARGPGAMRDRPAAPPAKGAEVSEQESGGTSSADEPAGGPQAAGRAEDAAQATSAGAQGKRTERQSQAVERRTRIAERQQRIAERQQRLAERQQQPTEAVAGEGDPPPASTRFPRLRLPAIHLGGIAKLAPGEPDIVLRFSEEGLDIIRRSSSAALGRLGWSDISELEIPAARGRLRRRRRQGAELVIRAGQGDANFEIPNLTPDQLRARLAPALARLQR